MNVIDRAPNPAGMSATLVGGGVVGGWSANAVVGVTAGTVVGVGTGAVATVVGGWVMSRVPWADLCPLAVTATPAPAPTTASASAAPATLRTITRRRMSRFAVGDTGGCPAAASRNAARRSSTCIAHQLLAEFHPQPLQRSVQRRFDRPFRTPHCLRDLAHR